MRRGRRLGADLLRERQDGPPKVVVEIHHQPRVGTRDFLEARQQSLHIREVIDEVGEQNVVERFFRGEFEGIGELELEFGVALAREIKDRGAEIDAHSTRRPDRRQQIAEAAADLQHPPVRGNQKRVMPLEQLMIKAPAFAQTESGPAIVKRATVRHRPSCYRKDGPKARTNKVG